MINLQIFKKTRINTKLGSISLSWGVVIFLVSFFCIAKAQESNPLDAKFLVNPHNIQNSSKTSTYQQLLTFDTCIVLKPDAAMGKDSYINSVLSTPSGTNRSIISAAWTYAGTPGVGRSLIEFDLSTIPVIATITSAKMNLFWDPTGSHVGHSSGSGPNTSFIRRVTSPWNEATVTFATQPSYTTVNQVILAQSAGVNDDYLNIPVDNLVFDIWTNPGTSFGFIIMQQTESYYRSLRFASSDNLNPSLWPELVVCYSVPILSNDQLDLILTEKSNSIELNWTISSTLDCKFFEVQTLKEGIWKTISKLNLGQTVNKYSIEYPKPLSENAYFRIVGHTIDGSEVTSNSVYFEIDEKPYLSISPNPTADFVSVNFSPSFVAEGDRIEFWDLHGKQMLSVATNSKGNVSQIDLGAFSAGVYFVRLGGMTTKLVIQK